MYPKTHKNLDDAIFALGCKVAFGTYDGEKLAVVEERACDHFPGDYVFVHTQDEKSGTCTTARPLSREQIESGEVGLMTDIIPCVGTPIRYVRILSSAEVACLVRNQPEPTESEG